MLSVTLAMTSVLWATVLFIGQTPPPGMAEAMRIQASDPAGAAKIL